MGRRERAAAVTGTAALLIAIGIFPERGHVAHVERAFGPDFEVFGRGGLHLFDIADLAAMHRHHRPDGNAVRI
ncbi:hypothetical protein [Paracoccus cavernae]|uniref:hypothetical protein n=1 Tax=Paracoccus cavernae TaxID=1571207 RepID=UPI00362EAA63